MIVTFAPINNSIRYTNCSHENHQQLLFYRLSDHESWCSKIAVHFIFTCYPVWDLYVFATCILYYSPNQYNSPTRTIHSICNNFFNFYPSQIWQFIFFAMESLVLFIIWNLYTSLNHKMIDITENSIEYQIKD